MSGLIKGTDKLPKFTIEVGFHRHPKWIGASAASIGVFVTSLSYCAEHSTDGRLVRSPISIEALAMALGVTAKDARKAKTELLERGMWEEADAWLRVHDYLDHNPSSAEVRDNARRRQAASTKANHAKYHVGTDGSPNAEVCAICAADSDSDSGSDSGSAPGLAPRGEERRGEESEDQEPPQPPPAGGGAESSEPNPNGKINPRAAGTNPRANAHRSSTKTKQIESARSRGRALATLDPPEALDRIDAEYGDRDQILIESAVQAYNAARELVNGR